MIASAIVGVGAFVGVLMFGPDPATDRSDQGPPSTSFGFPGGLNTDRGVQGQARTFVAQGLDFSAIALLDAHLETSPDFAWGWMFATQLCLRAQSSEDEDTRLSLELLGRARENLARLDRENRLPPIDTRSNYTNWFVAGWAARAAGDETLARERFLAGLEQNTLQTEPDSVGRLYDGACLLALAGRTEEALGRIERLAGIGYNNPRWMSRDPDLQPLHGDPRFHAAIGLASPQPAPDPSPDPGTEPGAGPVTENGP